MYTREFEVEMLGKNSPRINQKILVEDPTLGKQAAHGSNFSCFLKKVYILDLVHQCAKKIFASPTCSRR